MYHQHQGPSELFTTRTSFPMEQHLFLRGGNAQGDSGLVLSTDAKPRLKWTPELHQRFVDAVNQLGGAESKYNILISSQSTETSWILIFLFITQKLLQKQSWGSWAFQDSPCTIWKAISRYFRIRNPSAKNDICNCCSNHHFLDVTEIQA